MQTLKRTWFRELKTIGAPEADAGAYVRGVRQGGVIVFAAGSDEKVDTAAKMMNGHHAIELKELGVSEPHLSGNTTPHHKSYQQTGRVRSSGGGPVVRLVALSRKANVPGALWENPIFNVRSVPLNCDHCSNWRMRRSVPFSTATGISRGRTGVAYWRLHYVKVQRINTSGVPVA